MIRSDSCRHFMVGGVMTWTDLRGIPLDTERGRRGRVGEREGGEGQRWREAGEW